MKTSVGTIGWAKSGGALRRQDRLRLAGQVLLLQMSALPANLRIRLGFSDAATAGVDAGALVLPDSIAAVRAFEHAKALSEPWLFNHCLRTYAWAAMLAQRDRVHFDPELLFVASALHDLGLADSHNCRDLACSCFAVEGARAAHTFAAGLGWDTERCDRLAEAISLHLNVQVGLRHGPEAHLLHEGAALDVIGARLRHIGPDAARTVLQRYPRLGLKMHLVTSMKEQARVRPGSRAAFLAALGFIGRIRSAPFDDSSDPA